MNRLYYGDCLTIIQEMPLASVDLIYLDPPFNSKKDYHNLYKDETGRPLPDQIEAFCDMWTLDEERERCIRQMPVLMRKAGVDDSVAEFWRIWMNALRTTQPGLLAYLSYMVERLIWMKGLLRPTGSIYLHCDPTASHYIKIMMDGIFGHENFMNEVIWYYRKWTNAATHFQKNHDCLMIYCKTKGKHIFNKLYADDTPQQAKYDRGWDTNVVEGGVRQLLVYDKEKAKHKIKSELYDRVIYREDQQAVALPDVWEIPIINSQAKERMGYKTQKPLRLLKLVIQASSNEGSVVFDPFCGCATTIEAAHVLGREWIGIDIAIHAIKRVAKVRLEERLHLKEGKDFLIEGVPRNLEGAKDLWTRDKYHFQKWCVEQVDGFVTTKRTADGGIDGRLYFEMVGRDDLQSMVIEVKGGANVTIADLRALHSVLEREEAQMAGLIIMEPLGERKAKNFHKLMAEAGDLEIRGDIIRGKHFPRMQILSVPEILEGKLFNTPFARGRGSGQPELDGM